MKRISFVLLLLLGLLLSGNRAIAQDIIIMTDASIIRASIKLINAKAIVYKIWGEENGPEYQVNLDRVSKVQFQDGSERDFSYRYPGPASPFNRQEVVDMSGRLEYLKRGDYALGGRELDSDDMAESFMRQYGYLDTYTSAQRQRKWGNTLLIIGSVASGAGLAFYIGGAAEMPTTVTWTHYWDSTGKSWDSEKKYDGDYKSALALITVGTVFLGIGGAALNIAIPLKIIGSSRLRWIAEDYNEQHRYSADLKFGPTPNGVGFALAF